jgi:pimeloyl-ACP methyl ester carboxylesterase
MASEQTSRRVRVNGIELQVVEQGQGDPVLLLHGFPDSSRLWRHQIPALVEAGFRVIAPDLRGFGQSDRPEGVEQYQLERLLGDVLGLLDQADVGRARVVGHDWGAFLAWALASFVPARVEQLVALSVAHPSTIFGSIEQYEKSWYMLLFQLEGLAEEALRRDDWRLARAWMAGAPDLDAYLADLGRPGALTAGLNWYRANATPAGLFGLAAPVAWPPVAAPTLGFWSDRERYLTEDGFAKSADHVAGPYRYERIEGAGHWLQLDRPDRLNRLLIDFFRAADRPAR